MIPATRIITRTEDDQLAIRNGSRTKMFSGTHIWRTWWSWRKNRHKRRKQWIFACERMDNRTRCTLKTPYTVEHMDGIRRKVRDPN